MIGALLGWLTPVAAFFYVLGLWRGQQPQDDEPVDFSDIAAVSPVLAGTQQQDVNA